MRKTTLSGLLLLFILASLTGCGGGGGGGAAAAFQPTKAVLTLSTSGTLTSGTVIGGIEVDVDLPAGVTALASIPTATPSIMETDSGVVTASGAAVGADLVQGLYSTAATPSLHKIKVSLLKTAGFSSGVFATVNCNISAGFYPVSSDFHTANFNPVDLNGATITGLAVGITATIQ